MRCVRGTKPFAKRKIPLRGGTFLLSLTALTQISSDLAVLLALTALLALAVWILLLLAGLLAAALLLAGLLTRVLILLARILVRVGHTESPYLRCSEMQRQDNREGPGLVSEKTSVPARSLRGADLSRAWHWNPPKLPVYSRLSRTPCCCRSGFPLLEKYPRRGVPAAGAIAASRLKIRQPMDYFAQQLINGIVLGSIYGLIAIGYTMVYGIVGMILVSLGLTVVPVILLIVLLVSMAITALYGWTIERIAYRPLRHSFRLAPMLSAIGMSFILINYSQIAQGARVKPVPPIITGGYMLHEGSGGFVVQLSNIQIVVVITTIVLLAIFTWLVARTRLGRDMRACEQDQTMAALLGVDVDRTISMTFVIGAALAAVAGMMYLLYYGLVDFFMGFVAGIKAFTAAVLGGIGSLPGAMLGGLLIGLIETLWSAYFSVEYKDVAAFSILIIVLIFLPTGLLGRPEVEKV
jgi:branched-chain amino acid transport system permease protein